MILYRLVTDGDRPVTFYAPDISIAALVAVAAWQGVKMFDRDEERRTPFGATPADELPEPADLHRVPIFLFSRITEWWAKTAAPADRERGIDATFAARLDETASCLKTIVVGTREARAKFERDVDAIVDLGDKTRFLREHPMRTDTLADVNAARCMEVALEIDQRTIRAARDRAREEEGASIRRRQDEGDAARAAQVGRVLARAERERADA
jgi:hypothetical protein